MPKYYDGDDLMTHLKQFTKICVINGENIDVHKVWYFPKYTLKRWGEDWFACYETMNLVARWATAQQAFIAQFNMVWSEGHAITTNAKKHELIEDYYENFLQLCVIIPQQPNDVCLWETFH